MESLISERPVHMDARSVRQAQLYTLVICSSTNFFARPIVHSRQVITECILVAHFNNLEFSGIRISHLTGKNLCRDFKLVAKLCANYSFASVNPKPAFDWTITVVNLSSGVCTCCMCMHML